MNILIVSQYFHPEQFAINEIAPELVKQGHSVTVLTGLPNYPSGHVDKKYKWFRKRKETINGVKVIRCFEIGRKKSSLFLGLNYLSFAFSASIKALLIKEKFDIVYCYQLSPVTAGIPAIVYKLKNKVPLLLYCLDIWPDSVEFFVKNKSGIIYRLISNISKFVYQNSDHIAVSSKPFFDYLEKYHNIKRNNMTYLPQHGDSSYLMMDLDVEDNGCIDFLFAGHIGIGKNLDCILDAVWKLNDIPNFKVHFVGTGLYLETCKRIVEERGMSDKVKFHGWHQSKDMPKFYKLADACLLTLRHTSAAGLTMPGKLQTYMASGKPIIAAIDGAAREVIEESNCGLVVSAGDSEGLAQIMRKFIYEHPKYTNIGVNGRTYFKKHFTLEVYIKALNVDLNNTFHKGNRKVIDHEKSI